MPDGSGASTGRSATHTAVWHGVNDGLC